MSETKVVGCHQDRGEVYLDLHPEPVMAKVGSQEMQSHVAIAIATALTEGNEDTVQTAQWPSGATVEAGREDAPGYVSLIIQNGRDPDAPADRDIVCTQLNPDAALRLGLALVALSEKMRNAPFPE